MPVKMNIFYLAFYFTWQVALVHVQPDPHRAHRRRHGLYDLPPGGVAGALVGEDGLIIEEGLAAGRKRIDHDLVGGVEGAVDIAKADEVITSERDKVLWLHILQAD